MADQTTSEPPRPRRPKRSVTFVLVDDPPTPAQLAAWDRLIDRLAAPIEQHPEQ